MLENGKVKVAPSGRIGWHDLPEPERSQIQERLAGLTFTPVREWPEEEVTPVTTGPSEYMLRGPGDFRVFFTRTAEGVTVTDIVLQETLDRYFARKR